MALVFPLIRRPLATRLNAAFLLSRSPRYFSSHHHTLQRWVRHPQSEDPGSKKNSFFKFLDDIPKDALFIGILATNAVVFGMWYMASQKLKYQRDPSSFKWMVDHFVSSWNNVKSGRVWTLVTSCFSHEGIGHILFNGFTFYFMAQPVLHMLGSRQFLILYLGSGIASNVVSMGYSHFIEGRDKGSMGASAAIYSVISYLACVAPKMTFQLYGIIPIPAWLAVTGIFAYDAYSTVAKSRSQVDTVGHVAGLLSGIGYFLFRKKRMFL